MAHRKAGGSSKNLRDSNPCYLGIKRADGQRVKCGEIIVRQRGTKVMYGKNVSIGKDHTLFSTVDGIVKFEGKNKVSFTGKISKKKFVKVVENNQL